MRTLAAAFALAAALTVTAPVALAQSSTVPPSGGPPTITTNGVASTTLQGVSIFGILPIYTGLGFGLGGRYLFPVGIPPLLSHIPNTTIKDGWAVEVGADLLHWSYDYFGFSYSRTEVVVLGGLMWQVWFNDRFAVYPKIDLGYGIVDSYSDYAGTAVRPSYARFYASGEAGLLYRVSGGITLRAEAGSSGLKGGAGFLF